MELPWTKSKVMFVFMWYQHAHRFSNSLWFCLRWEIAGAGIWRFILWEVHFLQLKVNEFICSLKCQPFSWVFRIHKQFYTGKAFWGELCCILAAELQPLQSSSLVPVGSEALEHSLPWGTGPAPLLILTSNPTLSLLVHEEIWVNLVS